MRLLIISNRLPVTAFKSNNHITFKPSVGGLATGLTAFLNSNGNTLIQKEDCLWIGWPGIFVEQEYQEACKSDLIDNYNCYPVFLEEMAIKEFYSGFCNKTLWPLFHYFKDKVDYNNSFWHQYNNVNKIFANIIAEIVTEGDIVWIHDYHLLLLPSLLRNKIKLPDIPIGFFLHIPFPSYETFGLLPAECRIDLLNGMLGADVIGMHTSDYVECFQKTVEKTLAYQSHHNDILVAGKKVRVNAFPISIDFESFYNLALSQPINENRKLLKKSSNNCRLLLSIDRLDYTKGIANRLWAFEEFLKQYPEWQGKVVLILIVVPSRVEVEAYQKLKEEIDEIVGIINKKYSTNSYQPVSYYQRSISFTELVTFYSACDIAIVTPLRDGMNLIAKEYVASRFDQSGVLILSEMAGASQELLEAHIVNPDRQVETTEAIYHGLNCPIEEQNQRISEMQDYLRSHDVVKWAVDFIMEIVNVNEEKDLKNSVNLVSINSNNITIP